MIKKLVSKIKIVIILIFIIMSNLVLTSCWNYREIDSVDIIAGLGIDKEPNNDKYLITYEVISSMAGENKREVGTKIIQNRGEAIFDAVRKFVEKNGKVGYWSHTKVMIIGKNTAESGIIPMVDYTMRDGEFRPDMNILIADENLAADIFTSIYKDIPVVSFKLDETLKYQNKIGSFERVDVWNFTDKLAKEGFSPVVPLVYLEKESGKIIPKIRGMAVFKSDKMIGTLNGEETKYYLFIDDEIENEPIVIKYNEDGKNITICLEILKNKTKLKPTKIGNKIVMNIDIECDTSIIEIGGTANVIDEKGRKELEKYAEEHIEKNIVRLVNKVQYNYNSDIFGFGDTIKKENPELWKEVGDDWDKQFKNLEIDTNVKVNIKKSALIIEPIKIGE